MKKYVMCISVLLLFFSTITQASGKENSMIKVDLGARHISISAELKITKYNDGRIAPVENVKSIPIVDLDRIMKEMNSSEEEIKAYPIELKQQIVAKGGVKVKTSTKAKHYYNSLDGIRHLVSDSNKDEILLLQEKDRATIRQKDKTNAPLGSSKTDGIWSGYINIYYLGKNPANTEFIYDLYTTYRWDGYPNFFIIDSVANTWDAGISSASSLGANNYQVDATSNFIHESFIDIVRKPGGTKGDLDLAYAKSNYGYLRDQLRVPVSYSETTKQVASSYVHPWVGGVVKVVLSYLSISWNTFTGDEWHLDTTFTVAKK
ncbi:hypothetical protein [Paenibacillus taiwanensis]|uniref:hypothetical protein n=1 Tax=Paenibacillus taiwanensis TaxID=401638 RepID=UPI0004056E53|nr:hypothetical protein [Paenibacillus taiwanensis]